MGPSYMGPPLGFPNFSSLWLCQHAHSNALRRVNPGSGRIRWAGQGHCALGPCAPWKNPVKGPWLAAKARNRNLQHNHQGQKKPQDKTGQRQKSTTFQTQNLKTGFCSLTDHAKPTRHRWRKWSKRACLRRDPFASSPNYRVADGPSQMKHEN